jgi:hypothetical protein
MSEDRPLDKIIGSDRAGDLAVPGWLAGPIADVVG